ncbi:DUF4924 family protein [Segatella albensis]|jgi:hypothetical protein|uniref:DUF4924 family protein n=1 Tax=Segatella albensis TaxID=77768 RepID=UPI00042822A8|nr:DUF4924 family protein [Segatella albensis]
MFIAQELRKKSIAEYLLYMWQIEDIIRAMGCSLPVIRRGYISQFTNYTEEQREQEADWFGNLIRMMNEEGKREGGHLNINKILVQDLVDLHNRLLQSDKFPFYNGEYYKVLPFIVELRSKNKRAEDMARQAMEDGTADNEQLSLLNSNTENESEIETCLNALYGMMMLRLQKKEITPETTNAMKEITTFIGMLSDYYIKDNTEGLDFGDND